MPRVSEKNETPDGLPKKLEWLIGQARFQINNRGASYTAPTKNPLATQSKNIGHLLTLYGIAKDRPGITTVGLTASSQPNRTEKGWTVNWKDVRQIQLNPEERVVMLKEKWFTGGLGGGLGNFRLYCTRKLRNRCCNLPSILQPNSAANWSALSKLLYSVRIGNCIPSTSAPASNVNLSNLRQPVKLHSAVPKMVLSQGTEVRIALPIQWRISFTC